VIFFMVIYIFSNIESPNGFSADRNILLRQREQTKTYPYFAVLEKGLLFYKTNHVL
jgi:hypothetical protein